MFSSKISAKTTSGLFFVSLVFALIFFLSFSVIEVSAEEIVVDKESYSGDYSYIQEAVDAASYGDTVYVKPGTYEETIDLRNGITLEGAGPEET
ncbi:hypothetical protein KGY79_12775, partial [Candidatus Bipolaricaulota bacterium]|nr:hypothetical protein [Candidatus Bipolaricaulota bacterium]